MPAPFVASKGVVATSVQVTRADGTVEPERVVSYKHPDPLRQGVVTALLEAGHAFSVAELAALSTPHLFGRLIRHHGKQGE